MSMLVCMASHDLKNHVTSHFDHLDLTNGMVPLMTLLVICDTDIRSVALHDQKSYVAHYFSHLDMMKMVVQIDNAIGVT